MRGLRILLQGRPLSLIMCETYSRKRQSGTLDTILSAPLRSFSCLLNVAAIVVTGLFSGGEDNSGPFAGVWGLELSEVHEVAFRVLQALVALHILGVVVETLKARDALVPAMITGKKRRRSDEPGVDARRASAIALIAALLLGAAVSAVLISQPQVALSSTSSGQSQAEEMDD